MTIELAPGVLLDAAMHRPMASWAEDREEVGEQASPVFHTRPELQDVLVLADMLLGGLSLLTPDEVSELAGAVLSDTDALSRLVATPTQAQSWLAGLYGLHRVDPEGDGIEAQALLTALGEVVAAPQCAPDALAVLLIGALARSRWRLRGQVRDPREPSVCLASPGVG